MKQGSRKFIGFILTLIAYTLVLIIAITKVPNLVIDISLFSVQCAFGFGTIASLFFASNVLEHFADKNTTGAERSRPFPTSNEEVKTQ